MSPYSYFEQIDIVNKKKYDALRAFFFEKMSAKDVAQHYGYTVSSLYSLARDFREYLKNDTVEDFFFKDVVLGRKANACEELKEMIIGLRKQNFSAEEIVSILNSKTYKVTNQFNLILYTY